MRVLNINIKHVLKWYVALSLFSVLRSCVCWPCAWPGSREVIEGQPDGYFAAAMVRMKMDRACPS